MTYLIIVICLLIEYRFEPQKQLRRFAWYLRYVEWVRQKLGRFGPWFLLFVWLLLIPLVALSIYSLVRHSLYGLTDLLFGCLIVLYCFGPDNIFSELKAFVSADRFTYERARNLAQISLPSEPNAADPMIAQQVLARFNRAIFAPIFWFCIFGVFGVIVYRMTDLFARLGKEFDDGDTAKFIQFLKATLDWLPARLLGLIYLYSGNFKTGLPIYLEQGFTHFYGSENFLQAVGLAALDEHPTLEERTTLPLTKATQHFLNRAVMILLVILSLFVIA